MSHAPRGRKKVAILANHLAANRLPIFQRLAMQFDITVLYSGDQSDPNLRGRPEHQLSGFTAKRVSGLGISWTKRDGKAVLEKRQLWIDLSLVTALLRLRPDAIVSAEMGFRSLVALVYGQSFGCPVWIWWGGTPHTERGIARGKRLFRRWFAARVDRWFSYGATSTDYLLSLGVARRNVVEVQNCVPEYLFLAEQRPSVHLDVRPVLLCVGRLVPGKGVDLLLDAAASLQTEGLTFSLLIVGTGPEKSNLELKARTLNLCNVRFHEAVPPEFMAGIYRSADVLVFPTRDDVWGLVANEALLSGLPALVSVYAGCAPELVSLDSTFDPLDPTDFTAKLRRAVSGQLPPPDHSRLKRIHEVSDSIARELLAFLGGA